MARAYLEAPADGSPSAHRGATMHINLLLYLASVALSSPFHLAEALRPADGSALSGLPHRHASARHTAAQHSAMQALLEPTSMANVASPLRDPLSGPMRALRDAARDAHFGIDDSPDVWSRILPPNRAGDVTFAPAIVQDAMRRDVPMVGMRVVTY